MLGSHIESIITIFEDTMDKIMAHPSYDEQRGMLVGFKKILEEEVNLIEARLSMAKRLKRLEPSQYSETLDERIEERKEQMLSMPNWSTSRCPTEMNPGQWLI